MYKKLIEITEQGVHENTHALLCPECGESVLHQGDTHVFWRESEDSMEGLHTIAQGHRTVVNSDLKDNPSIRRDGVYIEMECEQCGPVRYKLAILQHKGQTFITWFDNRQAYGRKL
jgi:predicted RNA-binding Zn-ribbon protein involved in translation (DUF1610 family)